MRELRNNGAAVLHRVEAGEVVTITRDGRAVAQLAPLPPRRLSAAALIERFRRLPDIDAERFRADVDAMIDQTL